MMEEKKKSIKGEICLLVIILLFVLALIIISIGNSSIPELSKEEVKTLVMNELEPQLDEIREQLSVSNISVEFNIDDYEYRKPTIFSEGYISFDVYHDAYVSDEFSVLERGIYSDEFCEKYEEIDAIEYPVRLPKYRVHIYQHYDTTRFIDGNRNEYSFINGYRYKNGDSVNETPSRKDSNYTEYIPPTSNYDRPNDDKKVKTNTCGSCNRSWPAGDSGKNFMNIAKTGLCKNCEKNYHNMKQYLD